MKSLSTLFLVATMLLSATSLAHADNSTCAVSQELDRYRLLRRLSLDLQQRLPTYEEYLALDPHTEVPESVVDAMLDSDEFRLMARRFHEDLLWPNNSEAAIADVSNIITPISNFGPKSDILAVRSAARRKFWRQGTGNETCGDFEQTAFNPDGSPDVPFVEKDGVQYKEDGWVWIQPYWLPDSELVKVCAFDAQDAEFGSKGPCNERRSITDPKCGCGPNLRTCFSRETITTILEATREQMLLLIDDHTTGSQPYSELLTTTRTYVNGPLMHWKAHLAHMVNLNRTINVQSPGDVLIETPPVYTDETWQLSERSGSHSGIITLPAYTLRFQTNRGRANRMRIAFTGQYFVPASETDSNCDPTTDDLTQRCECRSCHQVLEPLAAHFSSVLEAGSAMHDPVELPIYQAACNPNENGQVPASCARFYVVDANSYNTGTLLTHQFADIDDALHQKIAANIESGPSGWAQTIIVGGQFASTTVRNLFRHVMGRDMILDPTRSDQEIDLLSSLAADFQSSDDFRALTKALVQLPQYRRVR